MIAALSTIENAVYRVQSEEAVTYGHVGRANEITNYIMNNTVYIQLHLHYLYGKVTTCFDTSVSSSGHYVQFVLFSVVIKSIYFYTLRRIWFKH